MVPSERAKRPYNSQRRRQQALDTRRLILERAQQLFERDGYPATTMDAIAAEAEVALKTVYSAFATKSGLLRAVWDRLLKGDTDDAPVAQREWYREVLDAPDARRQLELNARNARLAKTRIGPMLGVIRSAASVDADSAALWELIQSDFLENQRAIINAIDSRGQLRDGLDPDRAADILWTLNHPDVWLLLVAERGWSPESFEEWLADSSCQLLLPRTRARPRRMPHPRSP